MKDDGTLLVHSDRGISAMNYMSAHPKVDIDEMTDACGIKHITATSKNERIDISIYDVKLDMELDMGDDDSELRRVGTERQMQEWLSRPETFASVFGNDATFVGREYQTGKGPVDLLGMDSRDGQAMFIEVKRFAARKDIFQVIRYRESIQDAYDRAIEDGDDTIRTSNDASAIVIPTSSARDVHCVLVTERERKDVRDECDKHGIAFVLTGTGWRAQGIDNVSARHVR